MSRRFSLGDASRSFIASTVDVYPDDRELRDRLASLEIRLGRGVKRYVDHDGGRLYLWGKPFGSGFYELCVSTSCPSGFEFVHSLTVRDFELHIQSTLPLGLPVRITRRWFGLRDGVVAVAPASVTS